jgi:rubrerythrin
MRYITKYGESPIQNLKLINEIGLNDFILQEKEKWRCGACGNLLCVHRELCLNCGARNHFFPKA